MIAPSKVCKCIARAADYKSSRRRAITIEKGVVQDLFVKVRHQGTSRIQPYLTVAVFVWYGLTGSVQC